MTEIIERVARAIVEHISLGGTEWTDWTREAGKIIEAMREPTEAMIEAGKGPSYVAINDDYAGYLPAEDIANIWRAMIDAAQPH